MTPSCESCRYFSGVIIKGGLRKGACRKHTPRVDRDGSAAWPTVRPDDWCGEYAPTPLPPSGLETVER